MPEQAHHPGESRVLCKQWDRSCICEERNCTCNDPYMLTLPPALQGEVFA